MAEPDLKVPIDQVVAQYNGYLPSVAAVLAQAKPIAARDASGGPIANDPRHNYHGELAPGHGPLPPRSGTAPPDNYKKP